MLQDIFQSVWPETFGHSTTPQIFLRLHKFLRSMHEGSYELLNDDLVGFFNAIPQSRIMTTVNLLISQFKHRFPGHSGVLTVNLSPLQKHFRTFSGTVRSLHKMNFRSIHLEDVSDLVQLSFDSGKFVALGKLWSQIRGSPIGNQLSPV